MSKLQISHYSLIILIQFLMIGILIIGRLCPLSKGSIGYLHIEPGNNSLYVEDWDLTIKGQDRGNITFFVLPSYAPISAISQERSINKLYTDSGELFSDASLFHKQHVLVDTNDGNPAEWNIELLKSENMHTIDIKLYETDADQIVKENYTEASMKVFSPEGSLTYLDDILIKGRGNSTWLHTKKPYDLKLPKINPLIGLSASAKWSLISNNNDDTNMVNKLTMDLARDLGLKYTSDSEWCDLYINNEYMGNYLLCKEPGIGFGRVDINGYLVECDSREGDDHPSFTVGDSKYKIKDISKSCPADEKDIENYFSNIDGELHTTPVNISNIDLDSFAKRYLVEEFVYNHDSMGLSYFFYKEDDNGLLFAGPCWDYDLACGKFGLRDERYIDYTLPLEKQGSGRCDWDYNLMSSDTYNRVLSQIYEKNRPLFQNVINNRIDEYEARIGKATNVDRIMWENGHESRLMYSKTENKFRYLKFFLSKRLLLLDDLTGYKSNISSPDYNIEDTHEIILNMDDGTIKKIRVKDGTQMDPGDLPSYDKKRFDGWHYKRESGLFSYFIPIYEDTELILKEIA